MIFISTKDKGGVPEEMETPHILFFSAVTLPQLGKWLFEVLPLILKKNDGKGNDKDW